MFVRSLLCLLVVGSASVTAETCSGFEARLDALSAQVQAMIDKVQQLPGSFTGCGGIIGGKIEGQWVTTMWTDGRAPDYSAYAYDPQWCCDQCKATSPCTHWMLEFGGTKKRCILWTGRAMIDRPVVGGPGAYIFMQNEGTRLAKYMSGVIPDAGNMWGAPQDDTGKDTYMIDTDEQNGMVDAKKTYRWRGSSDAGLGLGMAPIGLFAEGFATCDTIGPFKPAWYSDTTDNGWVQITRGRHPLECCTLCAMHKGIGNQDRASPCSLWSYSYQTNKRQCVTRGDTYADLVSLPEPAWTINGQTAFQNANECAAYDLAGVNQRYRPDGTACTGTAFNARDWSTGLNHAMDITTIV